METTAACTESPMEAEEEDQCIVCWEPICTKSKLTLTCRHEACRACLHDWIERCEHDGQNEATCPHCRTTIDARSIQEILGRPYQRQLAEGEQVPLDDFTQYWLQDNAAHQCSNCGIWMVKDDDWDDLEATACVCGFIYCWHCDTAAQGCECEHCEFYDQLSDQTLSMEEASRFPAAGPDDLSNLNAYMEERKEAILERTYHDEMEDDDEEDEMNEATLEAPTTKSEGLDEPVASCALLTHCTDDLPSSPNAQENPAGADLVPVVTAAGADNLGKGATNSLPVQTEWDC